MWRMWSCGVVPDALLLWLGECFLRLLLFSSLLLVVSVLLLQSLARQQ
jgi:hypothetical protein